MFDMAFELRGIAKRIRQGYQHQQPFDSRELEHRILMERIRAGETVVYSPGVINKDLTP